MGFITHVVVQRIRQVNRILLVIRFYTSQQIA